MTRRCTHENCFPDTTCALGHIDRANCEYWKEQDIAKEGEVKQPETPTNDLPWNGYALGTSDISVLGGRGQPRVIGLIGPSNSGKTSLLAYIYMWLIKHGKIGDWRFAGSWTLGGWESIVQYGRWIGEPPPSFPPHTTSAGRHPGVLHIALRHSVSGNLRDVMFTDAPGEWFTQWARVPGDPNAVGARWVVNNSDVLLLLIDSKALATPEELPQTRRATRDLIERVGAENTHQRVTIVWTKDDIDVPDTTRNALERACSEFLPRADKRRTTVNMPGTIEQCFADAINAAENRTRLVEAIETRQSNDPFLAFRGIHVSA